MCIVYQLSFEHVTCTCYMSRAFIYFTENKAKLPELTPAQLTKLRQLTIVSLATKTKVIII